MDIIIRPAETSDFDSVVHIMNQVQTLHVNWRPDIYKESKNFSLWMLFRMLQVEKLFMLLHMKCTKNMALQKNQSTWNYYKQ